MEGPAAATAGAGSKRKKHMDQFLLLRPDTAQSGAEYLGVMEAEWRDKCYQPDSMDVE